MTQEKRKKPAPSPIATLEGGVLTIKIHLKRVPVSKPAIIPIKFMSRRIFIVIPPLTGGVEWKRIEVRPVGQKPKPKSTTNNNKTTTKN